MDEMEAACRCLTEIKMVMAQRLGAKVDFVKAYCTGMGWLGVKSGPVLCTSEREQKTK